MSDDAPLLDRAGIENAFRRLGDRLARRGVVADIYVFGGAAMALAYDARRATRDIDAVFQPHGVVIEEARAVASELGLPQWWLNEQASAYVARGSDVDLQVLVKHLGLRSVEQVLELCGQVFPEEEVPARARLVLEDILGDDEAGPQTPS
jgi:hypothetical protein